MANGASIQFDGFWERDECIQLLQACGRFLKHHISVDKEVEDQGSDMPVAEAGRANGASGVDSAAPDSAAPAAPDAAAATAAVSAMSLQPSGGASDKEVPVEVR